MIFKVKELKQGKEMATQESDRDKWIRRMGWIGQVLLDSLRMFSADVCGLVGSYLMAGIPSLERKRIVRRMANVKCLSLAVHPVDGRLWMGHRERKQIVVLNPENWSTRIIHLPVTGDCHSIAFHPESDRGDALAVHGLEMWKIRNHSWVLSTWNKSDSLRSNITAFAYDSQGNGYWTAGYGSLVRLEKNVDLTGIEVQENGDEYRAPCIGRSCMAGSERDILCVAEGKTGQLCWYDLQEKRWIQRQPLDFAFYCNGIAIDRSGQWLAADAYNNCVHVFGTDGMWRFAFARGQMNSAHSISIGPDGRVFVADKASVWVFAFEL